MQVSRWILVLILALEVHFAASYLIPLDPSSESEFGGLLRWFWRWAYGDSGLLGQITAAGGFPISGFFWRQPRLEYLRSRRWPRPGSGCRWPGGASWQALARSYSSA